LTNVYTILTVYCREFKTHKSEGIVKSVLIYGAETWSLYEDDRRRINATEMDALTHCGGVTQICVFNTVKLGTSASSP